MLFMFLQKSCDKWVVSSILLNKGTISWTPANHWSFGNKICETLSSQKYVRVMSPTPGFTHMNFLGRKCKDFSTHHCWYFGSLVIKNCFYFTKNWFCCSEHGGKNTVWDVKIFYFQWKILQKNPKGANADLEIVTIWNIDSWLSVKH